MSKTHLLATSAVVALMAVTVPSMAQQQGAPQREHAAPAEKIAPQNAPGVHNQMPNSRAGEAPRSPGRSETTGQAPREERQGRPSEHGLDQDRGRAEHPRKDQGTTGQAPREDRKGAESERNHATGQAPRDDHANRPSPGTHETTGQGAAGTALHNLAPEKRTRIHELIVKERNAPRVDRPNFSVSVGTRVPRTVPFMVIPREIVEIEPEWRGFEYFLIGDEMVIVNPRTMEIVAVVDV